MFLTIMCACQQHGMSHSNAFARNLLHAFVQREGNACSGDLITDSTCGKSFSFAQLVMLGISLLLKLMSINQQ